MPRQRPQDSAIIDEFGRRLAEVRREIGLSQDQLGELIGVQDKHISNIERGEVQPTLCTVVRLLTALDVTPDDLMGGIADPQVRTRHDLE
ncbi:helix-turn-helix domain-containing protein [Ilumatobacter nonamiensis]|uniref:helix-turn-helix domain-containing protein n=1 Tax=Ilumatobacter nonamiensis TaxID=467093 RepID=UPI00034BA8D1|nr:helix-turn-helix transcriptional regulator [Ilumatobacter nonamiensis]